MGSGRAQREHELFDELRSGLGAVLESMTGQPPAISADPLPSAPAEATLRWRQPMGSLPGAVWILAAEADWKAIGQAVLQTAGIEGSDDAELKSTYFEVTNQGLGGFGKALTNRLHYEATPTGGQEAADPPDAARWVELDIKMGDVSSTVILGIEDALLDAIGSMEDSAELEASADFSEPPAAMAPTVGPSQGADGGSKTFDLLLEVELPVSVSFGRAQVALKDVLKLSTGSIVELNRSIVEPVEIIVNNCVIARGEVVVIEGNFGVRIQEVVSRQERLRTLQ
jgi:flagellar motor switch protein FliN/FliY